LYRSTWYNDLAHFQQVIQGKTQPNAEHQQHHADFGKFCRNLRIGDEARCKWAN
jgi:hypothetical protein